MALALRLYVRLRVEVVRGDARVLVVVAWSVFSARRLRVPRPVCLMGAMWEMVVLQTVIRRMASQSGTAAQQLGLHCLVACSWCDLGLSVWTETAAATSPRSALAQVSQLLLVWMIGQRTLVLPQGWVEVAATGRLVAVAATDERLGWHQSRPAQS